MTFESLKNEVKDGQFCVCGNKLKYINTFYAHLGNYKCSSCKRKRPALNFSADILNVNDKIHFEIEDQCFISNYGIFNVYNVLAVYSILNVLKFNKDKIRILIQKLLEQNINQIGRMQKFIFDKELIFNLAKNPAGFNQTLDVIKNDKRFKDVIIVLNDNAVDGRDVSWIWDVEFEILKKSNLNYLVASGYRNYDLAIRFLYMSRTADFILNDIKRCIYLALASKSEVVYLIVNYSALVYTENILNSIMKQRKKD